MSAVRSASVTLCLLCSLSVAAQPPAVGTPVTRAVLADFEGPGTWRAYERGEGHGVEAAVSVRPGAPEGVEASGSASDPADPVPPQRQVLGVRLRFRELTDSSVAIEPEKPIPISGGTLWVFEAWASGEGFRHGLYAAFLDSQGLPYAEVLLGRLDYVGWKHMRAAPPLVHPPGGLLWNGFVLRIDPDSVTAAPQYLYFDLVTVTLVPDGPGAAP